MEKNIGLEIRSLANQLKRQINSNVVFQDNNLKSGYGYVMHFLYDNEGKEIYQKDIEEKISIRKSSVTNLLSNMEKSGYIEREQIQNDARFKKVMLTPKGKAIHERITQEFKVIERKLLEGFSEEESEKLFELLAKLEKNVEKI